MPSPLFGLGIAVLGGVGVYELVKRVILPKLGSSSATSTASTETAAAAATATPAPAAATATPATTSSTKLGAPTGRDASKKGQSGQGLNPVFLAAHPEWAGWHTGQPMPTSKPKSPGARAAAASKVSFSGGKPVMSGDVVKDLAALIAWHGVDPSDSGVVKKFQQSVGLSADGIMGQNTLASLQTALAAKGIPMPQVTLYKKQPAPAAPPKRDINISSAS